MLALLEQCGALQRGHFVLSSGLHSDRYCQCARLFEHPDLAGRVARAMAGRLRETAGVGRIDTVLAPALGAIVWGYELARALGVPSVFAERRPGEPFELRRGFALRPGDRVVLAEDVVTTGGSVLELVPIVEAAGAEVAAIASVVDRSRGAFAPRVPFVALAALEFETYEPDGLPEDLAAMPVIKPGSRATGTREGVHG
ncbi:MAG: orotate phosphoribosyltransferase [Planctomycetota bacterium]